MNFDEERNEETDQPNEDVEMADKVGDREADELKPSINGCSERKLFVGRISTKTTEESFREYFSKFGQVADSVLMRDEDSGRRRGFGFVIYADPEIADKVLKEDHTIDEYILFVYKVAVEEPVTNTTRIYVGGLPLSLTEDELKEHFSPYGYVVDHCIVLDRRTGRSRRFGYVSFDKEEAVEKVLSDGHIHELCGKQVEINRAAPKRAGAAGYRSSSYGVHAYNGRGRGYGNSGSGWNDGGNGGYGGGGTNEAYAYGNTGAANESYVPAYNGRRLGYGNSGNNWNYRGMGGYGGGGIK
uniref:Heterogeneous nuclear ribonucleoprotein A3 n=1 Tax=Solanum tuberosum TaxID=4113 RepID=M1A156_SOLTU